MDVINLTSPFDNLKVDIEDSFSKRNHFSETNTETDVLINTSAHYRDSGIECPNKDCCRKLGRTNHPSYLVWANAYSGQGVKSD